MCIICAVRLKAVHKAMYIHHKDGRDDDVDDDDDCTSDIDDDEVILAGKEGDSNDDDDCTSNNEDIVAVGEVEIISVQQSMKWKSKSTTPDSVAKTGT